MIMGFFKDFDAKDAAFIITISTLVLVGTIVVMTMFTNVESNGIVMLVLGKLLAILDGALMVFFSRRKDEDKILKPTKTK